MAKKWSNQDLPGVLHFVTGNVQNRRPIFKIESSCRALLNVCLELKAKRPYKMIAFVIMPDHFHLIVNPYDGEIRAWTSALKSLTAKKIIEISAENAFRKPDGKNQVWQESFKSIPLWSGWMIWQKINYLHANPLKAKLVGSTRDYYWSSFKSFYGEETEPILTVDKEWWWEDDVQKLHDVMTERIRKEAGASNPS